MTCTKKEWKAVEREFGQMIDAYEEEIFKYSGKHTRANGTWRMVRHRGLDGAMEHLAQSRDPARGFCWLVVAKKAKYTVESIVVRHPDCFSNNAINAARERLKDARKNPDKYMRLAKRKAMVRAKRK